MGVVTPAEAYLLAVKADETCRECTACKRATEQYTRFGDAIFALNSC